MNTTIKFTSFSDYENWAKENIDKLYGPYKSGKISGFHLSNYNEKVEKYKGLAIDGFSEIVPFIVVRAQYKGITDEFEFYYVDYLYPILKIGELLLQPLVESYNAKTYSFCFNDKRKNSKLGDFKCSLEKPTKVGKATIKKLTEWITYLTNVEVEEKAHIEYKNNKINAFLERIKPHENLITWNKDRTKGFISKGGLRYSFSIESSGYISENWEREICLSSNLETFLAIADNKYNI